MSDKLLVHYCAPTLAGIKTGSLFSYPFQCKKQVISHICHINRRLISKGLCMIPLRFFEHRVLLYLYRPANLATDFSDKKVQALLQQIGYTAGTPNHYVRKLIQRFQSSQNFPHEIGLFLSYPFDDVEGFIENRGAGFKCVGLWKVYGNMEHAKRTFERYQDCTDCYCDQWSKGIAVEQLTVAV